MKKQIRHLEHIDVLELFSNFSRRHGYELGEQQSREQFLAHVREALQKSETRESLIYGKRVESMFAYVVCALGKTDLLKQEDTGSFYTAESDIRIPDYRIHLSDGHRYLVEVKSFTNKNPRKKFTMKRKYCASLVRYAEMMDMELRFAIYFTSWRKWVFLPATAFTEHNDNYSIDLPVAIAKSEMITLGDCEIGTTPNLELHLLADPQDAREVGENDEVMFAPKDFKIFCRGQEVVDEAEKNIAYYLIKNGDWYDEEFHLIENNKLMGVKFVFSPEDDLHLQQGFSIIGNLSSMVSNGFRERTVKNGKVTALDLSVDPGALLVKIPDKYSGKNLPLWRFYMQPNEKFG